jgi:hypothetical protein
MGKRNRIAISNGRVRVATCVLLLSIGVVVAVPYAKRVSQRLVGPYDAPLRNAEVSQTKSPDKPKLVEPAQSGGPYDLSPNVIAGGGGASSGGNFTINGTVGEVSASNLQSGGAFTLSGGFWNMVSASSATSTPTPTPSPTSTPTPTPTPTPTATPTPLPTPTGFQLLLDASGPDPNQAAALDSELLLRDPFFVINPANVLNQSADPNTRVIVFVAGQQVLTGDTVVVELLDGQQQIYDVSAEYVGLVPNQNFYQVVFGLPNTLAAGTSVIRVMIVNRSLNTNTATIRIRT